MKLKIGLLIFLSCAVAANAYYLGRYSTPRTHNSKYKYFHNQNIYRHRNHATSTAAPVARSNRFAHFDRLLSRLDAADEPATVAKSFFTTTTTVPPTTLRAYHKKEEPKPVTEADYQYEDEGDEEDEDAAEDDDDSEESEDNKSESESRHHQQHDEGRRLSPHSAWKWAHMGTHEGVEELRNARMRAAAAATAATSSRPPTRPSDAEVKEAMQHYARINRDGSCKVPRPKVVSVKDVYPHPSKTYVPHCTILHQCGDDTGCCNSDARTCVPLTSHRVHLTFYITTFTMDNEYVTTVERLAFYNHTECRCESRGSSMMAQDMDPTANAAEQHNSYTFGSERNHVPKCRCPSAYTVRHHSDGKCTCECFDKQRDCLRAKKGKDYFSFEDRRCIRKGECLLPSCEFGSYMRSAGRCPRKREKFEVWSRYFNRDYYDSHKK